jgi:O-antigen/teichoic acid export membrane protein
MTLMAVNSIAAPKFAEFYGSNDISTLGKVARQSTKLIFWTSLPSIVLLGIFPGFFLGLYGPEFKAGTTSLIILAIAQFIAAISGSVGNILQMTGSQKTYQNIILSTTILNISLNLILIPIMGIEGAAIAAFFTIVIRNLVSVVVIKKKYGFLTIYPCSHIFRNHSGSQR